MWRDYMTECLAEAQKDGNTINRYENAPASFLYIIEYILTTVIDTIKLFSRVEIRVGLHGSLNMAFDWLVSMTSK